MYGDLADSIFSSESSKMKKTIKNLIIWDFDGVIADTECLWMENRRKLLNQKFNLGWDLSTTNSYIGGMSWRTRIATLQKMGIPVDEKFEEEAKTLDYAVMSKGFSLTPYITKIFDHTEIKQCIATGGAPDKTELKLKVAGLSKIFPKEKVFMAEMVKQGKPEPDLFLYAAEKNGEKPENCIVIEDSLAGIKAAQNAKMDVITYGGGKMNNNQDYIKKVKNLGVKYIYNDMRDIEKLLFE